MINYVVLRPGFNFWMQEHLGYFLAQGRKKRAVSGMRRATASSFGVSSGATGEGNCKLNPGKSHEVDDKGLRQIKD